MSDEKLSHVADAHGSVRCALCGIPGELEYEIGGWWALPTRRGLHWFARQLASGETEHVCSRDCAQRLERKRADHD